VEVVKTTVRKHVSPDVTACIFWLRNRQPDKWRDRKQRELEDQDGQTLAVPVVRIFTSKPEVGNA
jgi:hypothetical protein